ncbi:zinc finger protein 501-like [Cololabis saira]|uniref:zinc finger protein 501-like n=1 Tax=Cololabis saira TaxID=129043 RepID=UPI002AD5B26C|nr:zinc finger protein 501-like [Cololabis saira]
MSKVNHLREFIGQRLTAAAVEIFSVFEKTILEYEEELDRQRRLLDLAWKPEIRLNRIDVCKVEEDGDGVFSDQHLERSCSPDQEEPGNPQTTELEEDSSVQKMKHKEVEVDVSLVNLADEIFENGETGPDRGQLLFASSEARNKDEEGTERLRSDSSKTADLEPMRRHGDHEDSAVPSDSNCKSELTSTHTGKKAFSCSFCRKEFSKRCVLVEHMRSHTGERPYLCNTCGKAFTQLSALKRHITLHTGEKPHICETCGKSYRLRSSLQIHSRSHTGEKPYLCNYCNKTFTSLSNMKRHITTHTGERPHICKTCGKSYTDYSTLVVHSRTHTGERPYLCKICSKSFISSSNLKGHMTTHTGEKRYLCMTCNKGFSFRSDLLRHMKNHAEEKSGDS